MYLNIGLVVLHEFQSSCLTPKLEAISVEVNAPTDQEIFHMEKIMQQWKFCWFIYSDLRVVYLGMGEAKLDIEILLTMWRDKVQESFFYQQRIRY